MKDIARFIAGFERFQDKSFTEEAELFEQLVRGQSPAALRHDAPAVNAFEEARSSQQAAAEVSA